MYNLILFLSEYEIKFEIEKKPYFVISLKTYHGFGCFVHEIYCVPIGPLNLIKNKIFFLNLPF